MARSVCPEPTGVLADYLQARQGDLDPQTLRRYRHHLAPWQAFLLARGSDVGRCTKAEASAYWGTLARLAPGTRRLCLSQLRLFHDWMLETGAATGVNPWRTIRPPKQPKPLPEVIRQADRDAVAQALGAQDGPKGLRDRALVMFLDATGCRIGEALGLDTPRLDLVGRTARVRGKGGKERIVPFTIAAAEALQAWLKEGRPQWHKAVRGPVFIAADGSRLSYNTVRHMFERGRRDGDVEAHVHAHAYRHTFASEMIGQMHVKALQELLGHDSLSSTERYLHVRPEELRALYDLARRDGPGR